MFVKVNYKLPALRSSLGRNEHVIKHTDTARTEMSPTSTDCQYTKTNPIVYAIKSSFPR